MAGTVAGGINAAKTNKERHGENFYRSIGKLGDQKSKGTGFALVPRERVQEIGRKGGLTKGTNFRRKQV